MKNDQVGPDAVFGLAVVAIMLGGLFAVTSTVLWALHHVTR